ncbi:MAG: ATP-binding protein [Thermaurantimonas sp.]
MSSEIDFLWNLHSAFEFSNSIGNTHQLIPMLRESLHPLKETLHLNNILVIREAADGQLNTVYNVQEYKDTPDIQQAIDWLSTLVHDGHKESAQFLPTKPGDINNSTAIWPLKDFGYLLLYADNLTYSEEFAKSLSIPLQKLALACKNCELFEELDLERKKFQALFQSSTAAKALLTKEGKILDCNQRFKDLAGGSHSLTEYSTIDLVGFLHSKSDNEKLLNAISSAFEIKMKQELHVHSSFNGANYHFDISITPVNNEKNEITSVLLEAYDISKIYELQENLTRESRLLKAVIDLMPDAVFVKNKEGKRIISNKKDAEFSGFESNKEMLGKTNDEIYHPEYASILNADDDVVLTEGTAVINKEFFLINKKGQPYWLQMSKVPLTDELGTVYGLVGVSRDISQVKSLIKDLKYRADFEMLLVELSASFINSVQGELDEKINRALERVGRFCEADRVYVFQYDEPGKIMSNTHEWCAEGITPEKDNLQMIPADLIPQWNEKLQNHEIIHIPDVKKLPADWQTVKEILEPQGIQSLVVVPMVVNERLVGFAGFDAVRFKRIWSTEDIRLLRVFGDLLAVSVDRKWTDEKIYRYNSSLEKINNELNRFAYIVSHDLKAPLRAINNLSEWIEEDIGDKLEGDTKEQFKLLRGRVKRLENLINGILEYSRVGRIKSRIESFEVSKLLADLIERLSLPKHAEIKVQKTEMSLFSEKAALEKVLGHLIQNGVKYNQSERPVVEVTWFDHGKEVEFVVKDNGEGIHPDFHEKIFQMFQTLKARDEVESTGVGLAIVKKIIEDKGGRIWVESAPSEGSTFYFMWPKYEKKEALMNI